MDYVVRKAVESDRFNIARTVIYSFEKDLSALFKDLEQGVRLFENSIVLSRFYVAEHGGEIVGTIACADCTGRAVKVTKSDCKKQLGFIRGLIGFSIFSSELMSQLPYPETTGNIELVGVLEHARGNGIAKEMLKIIIENNSQYNEFVLDVTDVNVSAQKCYTDFGFREFKRESVKYAKQKGFNAKIYMKYT